MKKENGCLTLLWMGVIIFILTVVYVVVIKPYFPNII